MALRSICINFFSNVLIMYLVHVTCYIAEESDAELQLNVAKCKQSSILTSYKILIHNNYSNFNKEKEVKIVPSI
jgi:hypothetical protein